MISFIVEEGGKARRVEFDRLPVQIGREADAEIVLDSSRVSRRHAMLEVIASQVWLVDLQSANGTLRNGIRIDRVLLERGDVFSIGDASITFLGGEESDAQGAFPVGIDLEIPGYRILRELGRGLRTRVFEARQEALNRSVALKVLEERFRDLPAISTLFVRQARVQAKFHHSGVATGIDVGQVSKIPYFVVEFVHGRTLDTDSRLRGAFALAEIIPIAESLLLTLDDLHAAGQVAGHLHARNVMLSQEGRTVLLSLGFPFPTIAQAQAEPDFDPGDLPPEATQNPETSGPKGDLFQLGALVLRLMGAGQDASSHEGSRASPVVPENSWKDGAYDPLLPWLRKLVAVLPSDRYGSAESALKALKTLARDIPSSAAPSPSQPTASEAPVPAAAPRGPKSLKFKILSLSITALLFLLVHGSIVFFFSRCRDRGAEAKEPDPEFSLPDRSEGKSEEAIKEASPPSEDKESAASLAFDRLGIDVDLACADDDFPGALLLVHQFSLHHGGTAKSDAAILLATEVQDRRLARARVLLDETAKACKERELVAAEALLTKARRVAKDVMPSEFLVVEDGVKALREALKPVTVRKPDSNPKEEAPVAPEKAPRADLRALLDAALDSPTDAQKRAHAFEALPEVLRDEGLEARRVLLLATEATLRDVFLKFESQIGVAIEVPLRDGKTRKGKLLSVSGSDLVLSSEGEDVKIGVSEFSPEFFAARIGDLERSAQHALARALFQRLAGRKLDVWYDLHAALLLAEDPSQRKAAASWISELRPILRGAGSTN